MAVEREQILTISVEVDDDGMLIASVAELPGCFASGSSMDEVEEALTEAIEFYLSTDVSQVKLGRPLDLLGAGDSGGDVTVSERVDFVDA